MLPARLMQLLQCRTTTCQVGRVVAAWTVMPLHSEAVGYVLDFADPVGDVRWPAMGLAGDPL